MFPANRNSKSISNISKRINKIVPNKSSKNSFIAIKIFLNINLPLFIFIILKILCLYQIINPLQKCKGFCTLQTNLQNF